ncbi:transmembrane protease serine 9-like [Malaya genurostris]|uniref:transmembrane protease serine 9-like n=1 Tax=Malaya genurostris TaxID=325434 RepID=UPI0026F38242|nr:transmembrane protease serine 9-like [Malaya genurostris]
MRYFLLNGRVYISVGLLLYLKFVICSEQLYFTDTPPNGYFERETLADCPIRFYYDHSKFNAFYAFGGQRAYQGEFQHMVAIGWTTEDKIQYLCGGALISKRFVLTAAHCAVNGYGNAPDTVRIGDTDLGSTADDMYAQQISIREFRSHPKYRPSKKYFDIALIELTRDVEMNDAVCPACLWLEKDVPAESMSAIGFGATGFAEDLSPTLQKVTLSAINVTHCNDRIPFSHRSLPNGLASEQFCAGSDKMDTCEGDSGGPIQTERLDVNGVLVPLLVGIVSFGTPCMEGSTGVYTRVSSYLNWIEEETKRPMSYLACTRTSTCSNQKQRKINIDSPPSSPFHRLGLLWNHTDQNSFECGATLIDYRFAITSAFCARDKRGSPKYVTVDTFDEIVAIESIYIHPEYSPNLPQNDIALLKLSKYIKQGTDMLPACLWREEVIHARYGKMYYSAYSTALTGSGRYLPDNKVRYVIQSSIGDNGKCSNTEHQEKNLLCASNKIPLIPTVCQMDYGGPISNIAFVDYLPFLFGVVSNLSTGCEDNLIGTRINPHIRWIEDIVLEHNTDRLIFTP